MYIAVSYIAFCVVQHSIKNFTSSFTKVAIEASISVYQHGSCLVSSKVLSHKKSSVGPPYNNRN